MVMTLIDDSNTLPVILQGCCEHLISRIEFSLSLQVVVDDACMRRSIISWKFF